jgi:hypothetical protein
MKQEIEVKANVKEMAEMLFELDSKQVAEVFAEWKKLFDQEYERRKRDKETIWIYDLNHFMIYVIDEMDDDGKEFIRSAYAMLVYYLVDDISQKYKLPLN